MRQRLSVVRTHFGNIWLYWTPRWVAILLIDMQGSLVRTGGECGGGIGRVKWRGCKWVNTARPE
jgi:hypothetical protein